MSKELRREVIRRFQAGEIRTAIAKDIGFSRQTISNIVDALLKPEKVKAKAEAGHTKRLTGMELEKLKEMLETTQPEDHDFTSAPSGWNMEFGLQLAHKLFGKKPAVATMLPLLKPYARKIVVQEERDPKPEPPRPFDVRTLDKMLAQDEDFVKYCKSPIAKQIAWRSYETALREWEERNPEEDSAEVKETPKPVDQKIAGKRMGKYAGSRGSNSQPKKKRRR
jgi:hypothetical protein